MLFRSGAREGRWTSFLEERDRRIASIDASAKGHGWPIAGLLLVVFLVLAGRVELRFDEKIKPVAAVSFLMNERIEGRMYDNDEFGDYLIYAAYPRYKVFFDGRSDMYGTTRLKEYQKLTIFGPGWEDLVEKYDFGWFFIGSDSVLTRYLLERPEWRLIYSDNVANIHVKNSDRYRHLIDKYRNVKPFVPEEEEQKEEGR